MWQWRCGGGGDGKRLHYRISRASAAAATAAALHSTTVTPNQREDDGTQFSPVPILHPIIQSVRPSPPPLTTSALTPPECLLSAPSQPSSSLVPPLNPP